MGHLFPVGHSYKYSLKFQYLYILLNPLFQSDKFAVLENALLDGNDKIKFKGTQFLDKISEND